MSEAAQVVDTTRDYYDSDDADSFYFHVWGGEDIHVGIYDTPGEDIRTASHRTVKRMLASLDGLVPTLRVLDIGSGYGGSARVIAREIGCHVTALNLSTVQNKRARQMTRDQGLDPLVDVVDGSFEDLPFPDASYDVVWCQDSILHSARREQVLTEVDRVLRPGGQFIFTDPMQQDDVDLQRLQPVLERIHLPSMGTTSKYRKMAAKLGWAETNISPMPDMLVAHYSAVLRELQTRDAELQTICSAAYLERMKAGLQHWIDAGSEGLLDWGILHFTKP